MGYFSSAKNRALWNREMAILRQERQDRKDGVVSTVRAAESAQPENRVKNPVRVRITYEQLLAEERESSRQNLSPEKAERVRAREASKREPTREEPSLREPSLREPVLTRPEPQT